MMPHKTKKHTQNSDPAEAEGGAETSKTSVQNQEDQTAYLEDPSTDNIMMPHKTKKHTQNSDRAEAEGGAETSKTSVQNQEDQTAYLEDPSTDNIMMPHKTKKHTQNSDRAEAEGGAETSKTSVQNQEDQTAYLEDPSTDNIMMPHKTKKHTQNSDRAEAEGGAETSKTSVQNQEDQSAGLEIHYTGSQPQIYFATNVTDTIPHLSTLSIFHEIVINQNFCVKQKILPPNRVMKRNYNTYWDSLKLQLSRSPPDFTGVLDLLTTVKKSLISLLLPHQKHLTNEIEEVLDIDLLKKKAQHGALDVPYLSNYVLNLMSLLCVRDRDKAVETLSNITDPLQLLRNIIPVLYHMRLDKVNYTIRTIRPYLQRHSVQYERAKFQELLDRNPSLLDSTKKWLIRAATELFTPLPSSSDGPSSSSSTEGLTSVQQPLSFKMVLCQGYLNLLHWDRGDEEYPETLRMDKIRLQTIESQLNHLAVVISVILVSRSFAGSLLFSSPEFVNKLKCIVLALMEKFDSSPEKTMLNVSEEIFHKIHQDRKAMGLSTLSTENTLSLIGQLRNIAKKENCIRVIIGRRIHSFIKGCLYSGVQTSLLDFPTCLNLVKMELIDMGQKYVNIMRYNQEVFGPYYVEILNDIIPATETKEPEAHVI